MSVLNYLGAFLWGFVLLASFAGYGVAVGRLARFRPGDGGLAVAWGFSLMLVVGGALNLARVISPAVIVGLVIGGVVLWLALGGPRRLARGARRLSAWDMLLLLALLIGYVNWLCYNERPGEPGQGSGNYMISMGDDYAYTLMPYQMLQAGGLAIDPFFERSSGSSLGGMSFLQALVLAIFPVDYIHLADPGFAYLGIGALLISSRRLVGFPRLAFGLLLATFPTLYLNASAAFVPVFVLLALTRAFYFARPSNPVGTSFGIALLLAALLTLKTTLVSLSILFVLVWEVGLAVMTRSVRPIVHGAMIAAMAFAMITPYMVHSHLATKSPLYPYLGEGYRKETQAKYPHKTAFRDPSRPGFRTKLRVVLPTARTLLLVVGIAAALAGTLGRRSAPRLRLLLLASCVAGIVNVATYVAVFEISEFWRYANVSFCLMMAACCGALLLLGARGPYRRIWGAVGYALILGSVLIHLPRALAGSRDFPEVIRGVIAGRTRFTAAEYDRYRRLQAVLPEGSPYACFTFWPLLFDQARNPMYFLDNIGSISPPPGLPLDGPPEDMVAYLRGQGLEYLICPNVAECARLARAQDEFARNFAAGPGDELNLRRINLWVHSLVSNEAKAYRLFGAIASRYPLLADDGKLAVIDLGRRTSPAAAGPSGPGARPSGPT